jgi:sodium-coupled neutral amino acid transporter 11
MVKATTYQELVYNVLGKSGFLWLSLVQFLYPFICLISYNIIIGIIKKTKKLFLFKLK